jgi:predicted membrane channel-forming protein YqfA (hemolysin III family)
VTSADLLRFLIIITLGILSFITFLVVGTIIGLMWLDTWGCGDCKSYPVGVWILGLLGILFLISIGFEASDAPEPWDKWLKANWAVVFVVIASLIAFFIVVGWL